MRNRNRYSTTCSFWSRRGRERRHRIIHVGLHLQACIGLVGKSPWVSCPSWTRNACSPKQRCPDSSVEAKTYDHHVGESASWPGETLSWCTVLGWCRDDITGWLVNKQRPSGRDSRDPLPEVF